MAKRKPTYPTPEQIDTQTFQTRFGEKVMQYKITMRRRAFGSYPVVIGTVDGQTRMECDMSTTYKFHPNRFWDSVHIAAFDRLREIAVEASSVQA